MKILAIETATEACSAALLVDHEVVERFEVAPRRHTELLLPMVEAVLAEGGVAPSGLDAVAYGRGPGAFTGVRIATGVVQGIAFSLDLPVIPVSTLAALAQGAVERQGVANVYAAIDARMGEVYWGAYRDAGEGVVLHAEECVIAPAEVSSAPWGEAAFGAGSGWASYGDLLSTRVAVGGSDGAALPHAREVATLAVRPWLAGEGVEASAALPHYLRNKVAEKPGSRSRQ